MKLTLISQEKPFAAAPVPSFPPPPFRWSLVTGRDFARSIAWARRQPPNPITAGLRAQRLAAR